ncbi:MAG: hypothetical protein NT066_06615 [Candidatus Omnitrophica bacterium]|nr:hypothetical protein [Candidatus Omnitrophota bacterium]
MKFYEELRSLINKYCRENGSNTPDFTLAEYLQGCLNLFDNAVGKREQWYGRDFPEKGTEPPPHKEDRR